jgi:hypothetical protein
MIAVPLDLLRCVMRRFLHRLERRACFAIS